MAGLGDALEVAAHTLEVGTELASVAYSKVKDNQGPDDEDFDEAEVVFQDQDLLDDISVNFIERVRGLPESSLVKQLLLKLLYSHGEVELEDLDGDMEQGRFPAKPIKTIMLTDTKKIKYEIFLLLIYYIVHHEVRAINLSNCQLSVKQVVALSYGIRNSPNLAHLNLTDNKFGNKGVAAIALAVNESKKDASADGGIKKIVLENCGIKDDRGYIGRFIVAFNNALETLDLADNKIGPKGMQAVADVLDASCALVELDLRNNKIGDEGCIALMQSLDGTLKNLKKVYLSDNGITKNSCTEIGEALSRALWLYELRLRNNKLTDEGICDLCKGLEDDAQVKVLNLSNTDMQSDGFIALGIALSRNSELSELNVKGNRIRDDGITEFCEYLGAPRVEDEADDDDEGEDEEDRKEKRALKEYTRQLEREKVYKRAKFPSKLRILDLAENKISGDSMQRLGHWLLVNEKLEILSLASNIIEDVGAIALSRGLKFNKRLNTLNLNRCGIGNDGARALSVVIGLGTQNTTLENLFLDENPISKQKILKEVNESSQIALNISTEGAADSYQTLNTFGIRIANSETTKTFSQMMLVVATLTNWVDLATDSLVVYELYQSAQSGAVTYAWFACSLTFLVVPTLYIMIFMSKDEENGSMLVWGKNALLSLFQMRVASEAYHSYLMGEATSRYISLRVVEAAGESGPQSLLQLTYLIHSIARVGADPAEVSGALVIASVSMSLLMLGQTFSDLFEKHHIMASCHKTGFALYIRLFPTLVFHISQFAFRALTIALLATLFNPAVTLISIFCAILWRFFIRWFTMSERGIPFAILVTFLANSAWDKRVAVIIGFVTTVLEAVAVNTMLWFAPEQPIFGQQGSPLWAKNVDFQAIPAKETTILMTGLFVVYATIFITYIYPKHSYDQIREVMPEDLEALDQEAKDIEKQAIGKKAPEETEATETGWDLVRKAVL